MKKERKQIPIFYTVDDVYMPFLAVSLTSLIANTSRTNEYNIKILYTDISQENIQKIKKLERTNVTIEFVNFTEIVKKIKDKLHTRDYYTQTTYFRLFLPEVYTEYDKAIYIDSDTVVLEDIAELYDTDLGSNLIGGVPDGAVQTVPIFQDYVEKVVGISNYNNYFNAGVLLMNLKELRELKFQEKFIYLLTTTKFTVAQDQDYLNRICKGRVKIIDKGWNAMPMEDLKLEDSELKLIHYNLGAKPWHHDNILYEKYFWKYAKKTEYLDAINKEKENYTDEQKKNDDETTKKLIELAGKESDCVGDDRIIKTGESENTKKAQDRIEILKKIEILEKEGKFDQDVESNPPTIVLAPENIDYLRKRYYNKIKSSIANTMGKSFLRGLLRDNKLIIKDVIGIENLQSVDSGAMITCNHFNPFDSFTVESIFRQSGKSDEKKLYKVIREGNYTNFPGLYGFFFRNCDTLPLSSNKRTMIKFVEAVDTILKRKDFILIYPEQGMWWNYRKPRPLKNGAFHFAVRGNVPVIPIFITMKDSNIIGEDGFPVQEYYVHIEKPIYPKKELSERENIKYLKDENYKVWKKVYEDFYKIPLTYTTENIEEYLK